MTALTTKNPPSGMSLQDWGRLVREGYRVHYLPPAVAVPAVNTAMQKYQAAVDAYEACRNAPALTMSEHEAERADLTARADALEKGKDAPGTPNVDRYRAEWADHERKLEALALVIARREKDLQRAHRDHQQEIIDAHRGTAEKLTEEVLADLDAVAARCFELGRELKVAEWAERFPDNWRGRPKTWGEDLIVERRRAGEKVHAGDLLAVIRAITSATAPPDEPAVHVMGRDDEAA